MKKEFNFLFSFLIISSTIYILISTLYTNNIPVIGTSNVAITSNKIINFIGIKTYLLGDAIYFPDSHISLKIILECTGIYEMIILSSVILSYPTSVMSRLYGVILGIVIIYVLNMIRLVSISYILARHTDSFDFIDKYLWQISLVIFISLAYTIWLKLAERSSSSS